MYADHTLTPREAIRLCALGILAGGPQPYDDVVFAVRHFVSRMTGPSLELMGESIELLKYEGLVDGEPLAITERGRDVLNELLRANVRAGSGAMNDLIFALKMRFLHLLSAEEQASQVGLMIEACETELARIEDVTGDESGHLAGWLAIEAERLTARATYLKHVLAAGDPQLAAGHIGRVVGT
jgi:hypothetical protein